MLFQSLGASFGGEPLEIKIYHFGLVDHISYTNMSAVFYSKLVAQEIFSGNIFFPHFLFSTARLFLQPRMEVSSKLISGSQ